MLSTILKMCQDPTSFRTCDLFSEKNEKTLLLEGDSKYLRRGMGMEGGSFIWGSRGRSVGHLNQVQTWLARACSRPTKWNLVEHLFFRFATPVETSGKFQPGYKRSRFEYGMGWAAEWRDGGMEGWIKLGLNGSGNLLKEV